MGQVQTVRVSVNGTAPAQYLVIDEIDFDPDLYTRAPLVVVPPLTVDELTTAARADVATLWTTVGALLAKLDDDATDTGGDADYATTCALGDSALNPPEE